jgi:hypothetical protein
MVAMRFGYDPPNLYNEKTPRRATKYTIADLIAKTYGTVAAANCPDVSFVKSKYGYTRHGHLALFVQTLTSDHEGRRKHNMIWYVKNPHYSGRIYKCDSVMVTCDCKDFLYRLEYALWYKGLASIKHSNGAFPIIRNPRLRIRLCKHLLRSGLVIMRRKF